MERPAEALGRQRLQREGLAVAVELALDRAPLHALEQQAADPELGVQAQGLEGGQVEGRGRRGGLGLGGGRRHPVVEVDAVGIQVEAQGGGLRPSAGELHGAAGQLSLQLELPGRTGRAGAVAVLRLALQRQRLRLGAGGHLTRQLDRRQIEAALRQVELHRRRQGEPQRAGLAARAALHVALRQRNAQRTPGARALLGGDLHMQRLRGAEIGPGVEGPDLHRVVLQGQRRQLGLRAQGLAAVGAARGLDPPLLRRQGQRRAGDHAQAGGFELGLHRLQPRHIALHRQRQIGQGQAVLVWLGLQLAAQGHARRHRGLDEARRAPQMEGTGATALQPGKPEIERIDLPVDLGLVIVIGDHALLHLQAVHRKVEGAGRGIGFGFAVGQQIGEVEAPLRVAGDMDLRLDHDDPVDHQLASQQRQQIQMQAQIVRADEHGRRIALTEAERPGAQRQRREQLELDRARQGQGAVLALLHHLDQRGLVLVRIEGQQQNAQAAHQQNDRRQQGRHRALEQAGGPALARHRRAGLRGGDLSHDRGLHRGTGPPGAQCGFYRSTWPLILLIRYVDV